MQKRRQAPAIVAVMLFLAGQPVLAADLMAAAEGPFFAGEQLFREDKPAEAAKLLEVAVLDPGADEKAWLYLGACYEMLGRYDEAVTVLRKGSLSSVRYKPLFFYNMGNAFVLQGKNAFAEEMYDQALAANANFAQAYLNRGNVRLSLRNYEGASSDYSAYLALDPQSSQRSNIEEIVKRLGANIQAEQQALAQAEAQRLQAEQAKKLLLDQVQASLKASAEETTSLSAGSGQVQGYGDSLELDQ